MSSLFSNQTTLSNVSNTSDEWVLKVDVSEEMDNSEFITKHVEEFVKENNLPMIHIEALDDILYPSILYYPTTPIIAGGYLRRWVNGEDFYEEMHCDIDTYCRAGVYGTTKPKNSTHSVFEEHETREAFIKYLNSAYGPVEKNAMGFHHDVGKVSYNDKEFEMQIMSRSFVLHNSETPAKLLKTYDMTLSMIAYDFSSRTITYHKDFIEVNKNKIMDFNKSARINSPESQMSRFFKLSDEGYTPAPGMYKEFCKWTYNAFSRNNGQSPNDMYSLGH